MYASRNKREEAGAKSHQGGQQDPGKGETETWTEGTNRRENRSGTLTPAGDIRTEKTPKTIPGETTTQGNPTDVEEAAVKKKPAEVEETTGEEGQTPGGAMASTAGEDRISGRESEGCHTGQYCNVWVLC